MAFRDRLVAAVTIVIVGTACGGGSSTSSPTAPTATAPPATTPAPTAPAPVSVTFTLQIAAPSASAIVVTGGAKQQHRATVTGAVTVINADAIANMACSTNIAGILATVPELTLTNTTLRNNEARPINQGIQFDTTLPSDFTNAALSCNLTGTDSRGGAISISRNVALTSSVLSPNVAACVPNATTICAFNRFRITIDRTTVAGNVSPAVVTPGGRFDDGGYFGLTQTTTPEVLVQVINRCAQENRYRVFFQSGTDEDFSVFLFDSMTAIRQIYRNPRGERTPSFSDNVGLPSCP
jgi:hypothetical protein